MPYTVLQLLGAFVGAFLLGSLIEYFVHRWMHDGRLLGQKHAEHHAEGVGQGWLGEFKDYVLPAVPLAPLTFLISVPVGIGACLGSLVYGACAAYAHQLQHERPELVFWLARPVHHLHHRYKMWDHNFGILLDVWDRLFGTYRVEAWKPAIRPPDRTWSDYLRIKWR
jgi:sterol desaturase/sphingolipid hydroxylase (fatty acid hydroxylase superfamily)